MNQDQLTKIWDANATAWTDLARQGFDTFRDLVNTPAFFSQLPDIKGLKGIDIGCGEGYNTRLLAAKGAAMTGIDISPTFIRLANDFKNEASSIVYSVADAQDMPYPDCQFDFATGFMSFMDIPDTSKLLKETYRILKPGGFLQFSISHPCFNPSKRRNLKDDAGVTQALEISGYFSPVHGETEERTFSAVPEELRRNYPMFIIPRFTRTLADWVNTIIQCGFMIKRMDEPRTDESIAIKHPEMTMSTQIPYFLHFHCLKAIGI